MFIDRVRIKVEAGGGGKGCTSFRREKYVSHGGPNGGDGGDGGDVLIVAASRLGTLQDVRYHPEWRGNRGAHGMGSDMHGKGGEDLTILVPAGTVVKDRETGEILADLVEDNEIYIAAHGGQGGKGNARFATSTNRAPQFHEQGEPGELVELQLELKLLADVGIVGLPNAGKSTFLAAVSKATPKIADYPFTTLTPNLGVVTLGEYRSLVIADIPGIIEGAAQGKGLGHDFLRHIERTKVLLYFVDSLFQEPAETFAILENELLEHSAEFAKRPKILAFTKSDITENREAFETMRKTFPDSVLISSVSGDGIPELLELLWTTVERYNRELEEGADEAEPEVEYTFDAPFTVDACEGGYEIGGKKVIRAVRMTDFENEEGLRHLDKVLKKMGLYKALQRMGAKDGDTIFVSDIEMEYRE
ncbi:MAG: GTPase ObgE [Candidatus Hydrogenedentota bacterium]